MLWSQFDTEILECNRSDHFVNDYWPTMYAGHYGNIGYGVLSPGIHTVCLRVRVYLKGHI